MNEQKPLDQLKKDVDIVEYISKFLPLVKKGSNLVCCCPFHGEETPSFTVSPSKQRFNCFGGCHGVGGDVFDFEMQYNKSSKIEAINKIREFDNSDYIPYNQVKNYQQIKESQEPIKTPEEIQKRLNNISMALLRNSSKINIFKSTELEINQEKKYHVSIAPSFQKLFEKNSFTIDKSLIKRISYILEKVLAYDTLFNCPAIIIRDHNSNICDISKYRPQKPAKFNNWGNPKYMYEKEENKLKNRGENFLFPFSREMEKLIDKNSFFFIGEGLKNAVIALLFGVPFISLESVSNGINQKLLEFIKEKSKTKKIIGAFDGDGESEEKDKKGKGAYLSAKETLGLEFDNLFAFDSDIDFADYLKDEHDLINFESKFEELFLSKVSFYDNHKEN